MDPDRNKEEPLPKWEDEKEAATNLQLRVMEYALGRLADAEVIEIGDDLDQQIFDAVFDDLKEEVLPDLDGEQVSVLSSIANLALVKQFGPSETGVVVAGFGSEEIFPTLVHYTIFGIVGNKLKYATHDVIDIDRVGVRAKVLPFAQKEMVERFLYGLDQGIRSDIARFCEKSLPSIRENLLDQLVIDPIDKDALEGQAKAAEKAFLDGLVSESFDSIRRESEAEIDEMVEFMPKPELARMAEALVDLTSIKRRVTRGFETVGGPIDVAVLSKAEGFVWVKRKHYFPPELNRRFLERTSGQDRPEGGADVR
ncbi:hypothetical protein ACFO0A_15110 [Novosphingobium tardum]|uniref:Uncharacterized protein n=1 Tax=Novosphingobium tardum TaxID=1538021 RepID=A0ABV8RT86_9SPHN